MGTRARRGYRLLVPSQIVQRPSSSPKLPATDEASKSRFETASHSEAERAVLMRAEGLSTTVYWISSAAAEWGGLPR